MLVKNLPQSLSQKVFDNMAELLTFIHDHQVVTEYGELSKTEVSTEMLEAQAKATQLPESEFVDL